MKTFAKIIVVALVAAISTWVFAITFAVGAQMAMATATVTQAAIEREHSLYPSAEADEHFAIVYEQAQKVRQELLTGPWAGIARANAIVKILLACFSGAIACLSIYYLGSQIKQFIVNCVRNYIDAKQEAKQRIARAERIKRSEMEMARRARIKMAREVAQNEFLRSRRDAVKAQMNELSGED